jgi:uncharacterized membrane protein
VGRGVQARIFPYVFGHFRPHDHVLVNGAIEYPVLTGVFMWGSGVFADSADEYLVHSAVLLAPFGLLAAFLLARLGGARALLFAAAPAIVLYAFHNWDLLVVAATVGGFYIWRKGDPHLAAALFAVGASLKMYPALFVAPLVLEQLRARNGRQAAEVAAFGAGTFAVINLPFVLRNFDGWWATYAFHRARGPNFDSIWNLTDAGLFSIPRLDAPGVNLASTLLMLVFFAAALGAGWIRSRREKVYPVVPVSAALIASFLLWNKVHSPQYTLWILPFFVLVSIPIGWWIAYSLVDLMVYVGVFTFFYDYAARGIFESPAQDAMEAGVWLRALLLLLLFVVFLRSSSHPPDTVQPVGEPVGAA